METNLTQLELNFRQRRKCNIKTAVDRIMENFRKEQRAEYFQQRKYFGRDKFMVFNGVQLY
jgi:hypothetical protein